MIFMIYGCYFIVFCYSDVKSVTQLMTGNDTTSRAPKQVNTPQPTVTNGPYSNGYMPQQSPPMGNLRKTPPGSHGKPSPLMQRKINV